MRVHAAILALGLVAAFGSALEAGDGPAATKRPITRSECERLVAQLVYPHKPTFAAHYVLEPPMNMDEKALAKIRAAYDTLSDRIEVSLPVLAKHVEDERFSYVYEDVGTSGAFVKSSVGGACEDIVQAHVEVYRRYLERLDESDIPRCTSFIAECGGVRKWWQGRKGKTLAELQLEAVEWALRQKKPRYFKSKADWTRALKDVEKMADDIRASGKSIPVEHHVKFFSK